MDEDIVAIIAGTVMVSIPLLAISARIALKPVVDAIVRLRGDVDANQRRLQEQRLVMLEEELVDLRHELGDLRSARTFDRELAANRESDRIPERT